MTKGTYFSFCAIAVILIGDSDYFVLTFKEVTEHIHGIALAKGRRHRSAEEALGILVALIKKVPSPLVDGAWITELLRSAARESMGDEKFIMFMRLNARREEEQAASDTKPPGTPIPEDILFDKIMHNIRACVEKEEGWWDEAVYGGLIAIADIPGLGTCLPEVESLRTLSRAMEKGGDENKSRPFRVRKAAYDVVLAARDGWLRSADLRKTLEGLDIPRRLHSVVIETGRTDHQRSFLEMMEILSEDRYWRSYLREAMDIWVPFRHEGLERVQRILVTVGELEFPGGDTSKPSHGKSLEKLVEDEWARVPARPLHHLTVDLLTPFAEITEWLDVLFTESDRMAILAAVEQVIPSLEKRRDVGYGGPGEDIRGIIGRVIEKLRPSTKPAAGCSTFP